MKNNPFSMSVVGHRERSSMDTNSQNTNSQSNQSPRIIAAVRCYTNKISLPWFERTLGRLNITQKFAYSYALALGIAIIGTGIGLSLGDYHERQALKTLYLADTQERDLEDLKVAVTEMRLHPQRLMPTFGKAIFLDFERAHFSLQIERAKENLGDLDRFLEQYPHHLAVDPKRFRELLQRYEDAIEDYRVAIVALQSQLDFANLADEDIPGGRQQLIAFLSSPTSLKREKRFERLAEDLTRIIVAAENQKMRASQNLTDNRKRRLSIVALSMGLSVALAAFLSLLMGRAIARPLIAVKNVAREVAREGNFNLRTAIDTPDEIGTLATSLNRLIQWMEEYARELQQTQTQLIQNEKMSSLGQMVGGIAHEINNPVSFIHGNIEYLDGYLQNLLALIQHYQKLYPQPPDPLRSQIEAIELEFLIEDCPKIFASMKQGTVRIQSIVKSLRNFSRLDESEMKAVDLHEGLNSTLIVLNNRIGDRIEIVQNYGDLPLVECYPAQLNQVFFHLLANALDALEELISPNSSKHPRIVIQTEQIDINSVRVSIGDNGSGIPSEIRTKLFDPFFTTKPIGKGTGLGLAVVYKIIEKHQGTIAVESTENKGTQFDIVLPLHRDRLQSSDEEKRERSSINKLSTLA
ncbi:MAG: HAMP domain-containing histidine kinase [Cyanobacteria bacterium SBLK]|nr:HAMP domain-containing histidine kinase [Cyanobacteria bacterium SBLK]